MARTGVNFNPDRMSAGLGGKLYIMGREEAVEKPEKETEKPGRAVDEVVVT